MPMYYVIWNDVDNNRHKIHKLMGECEKDEDDISILFFSQYEWQVENKAKQLLNRCNCLASCSYSENDDPCRVSKCVSCT